MTEASTQATWPSGSAPYMCGACGAQWYDGIQQDCGQYGNAKAYCQPSPCVAQLKELPPAEALRSPAPSVAAPDREWRCFHCDEVFADRVTAQEHFGDSECEECACKLSATDKGLLGLYREARQQLDEYHREDNESYREYYRLGAAHSTALREAEQSGYDKGLADGRGLLGGRVPTREEIAQTICRMLCAERGDEYDPNIDASDADYAIADAILALMRGNT